MLKAFRVACAVVAVALPVLACAQPAWPTKPVRLVLPYPPGGNVDGAARIISERLQAELGQPFLVDNRPGAGGLIAGEFVARSAPDGYTFFMGANGPILFSPVIFKRNVYNWKKDFTPIGSVSFTPLVLQVHPSTPYKTIGELMAAAKKPDNHLTMASPGAGTTNHLVSEYLQRESGGHWVTVHYKGNAPATTDLLGGQVQFNFDQLSVSQPFIQQGKTRALAVTSARRVPQLPDVPTLQEAGFKGFEAETFTGILAPVGTPADIVARFSTALRKILAEKTVQDRFQGLGAEARGMTPEQFTQYLTKEDARWIPIIKQANITAE
ncbi:MULTISPECIES: Bug family tripartite tricarboxylate transporter substrate binding protein [unclassified Variovorax]|uniref:Bug family tripartite tricarboxylate transporter substrate binding protein n=1 Tax=unclassified Variovorax TaxID=663243 RepID=UPI0013163E5A|nr:MULTISPECIES: tripartite tricarboxylate transporter substrate binding protein [unclassified Variovorax]VTU15286.1 Argininosuccinate lyase [Variovorax sp. SRS16]VTU22911.1 Argininosuccinate lyase [Variovorax sp. PBL-E5]